MIREMIPTKDGSFTIAVPAMNVTYHSVHGAIQESQHIYIKAGLGFVAEQFQPMDTLYILEMGFGTGLNALLTLMEAQNRQQKIYYTTIELYPLNENERSLLNYCELLNRPDLKPLFDKLHTSEWEKEINITPFFTLLKINQSLINFRIYHYHHLIYFDAFAPAAQPELWTNEVFEKIYKILFQPGVLVTYCSKGVVQRAMIKAGFRIEKIQGPPGKREIIRPGFKYHTV